MIWYSSSTPMVKSAAAAGMAEDSPSGIGLDFDLGPCDPQPRHRLTNDCAVLGSFCSLLDGGQAPSLQLDRPTLTVRLIDGLEQGHDAAAVVAGHERRAIVDDRPQEILDLERVIMIDGVDFLEAGPVLGLEIAPDRSSSPGIVQRSLSGGSAIARHARDEGRAAVGLDADRGAV